MKTLKIIIHQLLCISIILSLSACHLKHLNTQKTRNSDRQTQDVSTQTSQTESSRARRLISMSDSTNRHYQITIFPLDTFSFSLKDGFKGRASGIEIFGAMQQVQIVNDSMAFIEEKQSDIQSDQKSRINKTETTAVKTLENKGFRLILCLIWLGVTGLIVWLYIRFRTRPY